jgi:hypothetical protein
MFKSPLTSGVEKQEWSKATDKAKEAACSAGEMASHAASAIGGAARQATSNIGQRADDLTATAGRKIEELGDRLGRQAPDSGILGDATQSVARSIHAGGEYVNNAKLSGMAEDVTQLVRRNPISAILIAIGIGVIVGRKAGG